MKLYELLTGCITLAADSLLILWWQINPSEWTVGSECVMELVHQKLSGFICEHSICCPVSGVAIWPQQLFKYQHSSACQGVG